MSKTYHTSLASGGWQRFTLAEQLGNVGSGVSRAIIWRPKDKEKYDHAIERALELMDLTIADERWRLRLKELVRVRAVFADTWLGAEEFGDTLESLDQYFFAFALQSRRDR